MDFVRLGPVGTYQYTPDKLIEGYNSLIWTERWQDPGEFELKSFDVDTINALLPEDTLVSHLDTREVMQVESRSIQMVGQGADLRPEITVKGRSATIILNHRWVESTYQKRRKMRKAYSATSACCVMLNNAIDNGTGVDFTRGDNDPDTENVVNIYPWTTKDIIPNVAITESVSAEGPARWWFLQQGMLLEQMKKMLIDQDLGIRCLRPVNPSTATVVTVNGSLAQLGNVIRTVTQNPTQLQFNVYTGVDRSASVSFSKLQGHLVADEYLTAVQDWKSVVEIMSGEIEVADVYRPGESGLTGWQRKTIGFDAGTPEIPDPPTKPDGLKSNATKAQKTAHANAMDKWIDKMARWRNKRAAIIADFREEQSAAALRVLKEQRKVNMFQADISDLTPYKYKTHYDLGDTVNLVGDYGKTANMIVQEYVRTEDESGDRGYPGLVAP